MSPDGSMLARFPVSIEFPVHWSEMDAFAHVNNAIYLRWFESARIAYFEQIAVAQKLETGGERPILAKATVEFRRPVTYPDLIRVSSTVLRLGNTSFVMGYQAFSRAQNGALVAEGESVVVMLDATLGQKVTLSDELRRKIAALEASSP